MVAETSGSEKALGVAPESPAAVSGFEEEFLNWLSSESVTHRHLELEGRSGTVLLLGGDQEGILDEASSAPPASGLALHLLPTPRCLQSCAPPAAMAQLTAANPSLQIVHLHEDIWQHRGDICRSRLLARLGRLGSRTFARKTIAKRISAEVYVPFLEDHHLWGPTRAKHAYGLHCVTTGELMAVATFSARRHVIRGGVRHRSHELLRCCAKRDGHVVGGISKLIAAFIKDHRPDDIVTVIDRDWGTGSKSWHLLGFETVQTMPPLPMAIGEDGIRRHLIGAGIMPMDDDSSALESSQISSTLKGNGHGGKRTKKGSRPGLPCLVQESLASHCTAGEVRQFLASHRFFIVHDTGVERLMALYGGPPGRSKHCGSSTNHDGIGDNNNAGQEYSSTALEAWAHSVPRYGGQYYSDNSGIYLLLRSSEQDRLSRLNHHTTIAMQ